MIDKLAGPAHLVDNQWHTTRDALLSKANTKLVSSVVTNISTIDYTVNQIGQRTDAARTGAATNSSAWGYDPLGQLTISNDSIEASDRAYAYDSIGNRIKTASGTLTLPGSPTYAANALNQYTTIPQAAATPTYDLDGNMTTGPLPVSPTVTRTLVWDGENRLVEVRTSADTSGTSIVKFTYEAMSRRVAKITSSSTTRYIYDGWNCIAEYTESTPAVSKTYVWGLDLSGSLQGAGGVGGLLAVNQDGKTYYPCYDGNGNVTEYLDSSKAVTAHFEYDPFGNLTVDTHSKAATFPYRFSTKPQDAETGFYYYGYRYYDPVIGRWPSRDPIGERGGVNVYEFIRNNVVNFLDRLGTNLVPYKENSAEINYNIPDVEFDKKYNSEPEDSTNPYNNKMMGITSSGKSDDWPREIATCEGCKLKLNGNLKVRIIIKPSKKGAVGADGKVVEDHERIHESIIADQWNNLVAKLDPFDGVAFPSKECCKEWAIFSNQYSVVSMWAQSVTNLQFDVDAYGGKPKAKDEAQAEYEKQAGILRGVQKELEQICK